MPNRQSKITPTTQTYYVLNEGGTSWDAESIKRFPHLGDENGEPRGYPIAGAMILNKIATEYYGKQYVGQQVGDGMRDMLSNDSEYVFHMSEEDVAQYVYDAEEKTTYLGYDPFTKESKYLEGVTRLEYWKSLSYSDDKDKQTHPDNPREGENCFGAVFAYDFQVYREAPPIHHVLADLIKNDILPYGTYILYVSW